jgi:hypothetical protein
MPRTGRLTHWFAALVLLVATASAQDATITGTIEGRVGDAAKTWYALQFDVEGELQDTVEVEDYGFQVDVTIQAHVEPRFLMREALVIGAGFDSLTGCPCTATYVEVFYLGEGSMFSNVYKTEEGTLVVETATPLGDGRMRLVGSFEFEASFHADAFGEGDPNDVVTIEGTFDVEGGPLP